MIDQSTHMLRLTCVLLAPLFAATVVLAGEDRLRVAITDFGYIDEPMGLDPDAANLTSAVQAQLSGQPQFEWVERQEIARAFDEMALGLAGVAGEAGAMRAGKLVRADMLVRGVLVPSGEDNVSLELAVVDPRRADLLAARSVALSLDSRGRLALDGGSRREVAGQLADALKDAAAQLDEIAGKRVIAPLFFRNTGPHSRLDFLEERLLDALGSQADAAPDVHGLRFPRKADAEGEVELVLMGLTEEDSDAWKEVADVYVWGEFEELETEGDPPFEEVPFRIGLTLWKAGAEPVTFEETGKVERLEEIVEQISGYVVKHSMLPDSGSVSGPDERLHVARELKERADGVRRQIAEAGGGEFLSVPEGRRLYAYQLKLLETACFFDPLDRDLQRERLNRAWLHANPLDPLATLGGHWRRLDQYLAYLDRFPVDAAGRPEYRLRKQLVLAIKDAAEALGRSRFHKLPAGVAHSQKLHLAELLVREIHLVNKVPPDGDRNTIGALNVEFFDILYGRGVSGSSLMHDPEVIYLFTEELWPYFSDEYAAWRGRSIGEQGFQQFAKYLLSAYRIFGLRHEAIAKLEEGYGEAPQGSLEEDGPLPGPKGQSESSSVRKTRREPWSAAEEEPADLPGFDMPQTVRLPVEEVVLWPAFFYGETDRFYLERHPAHDWNFIRWKEGLLWLSETANGRPLPADDGWTNDAGSHYLWVYDPSSGSAQNFSRKLPPHTGILDMLIDREDLWFAVSRDGAWRWRPGTGEVKRFGAGDGMVSHDVRAGVRMGDSLYFSGVPSEGAVSSRFSKETEQWFAVSGKTPAVGGGSADGVREMHRFGEWLLLTGKEAVFYKPESRSWQPVSLPDAGRPGRGRPGREVLAAVDDDGVWLAGDGFLFQATPERSPGERREVWDLPGRPTAMVRQGAVLWVAVDPNFAYDREGASNVHPGSAPAVLLAFDLEAEKWMARVPLTDSFIEHLAAGEGRLWAAAERLWEVDTSALHRSVRATESAEERRGRLWRALFFDDEYALHHAIWKDDKAAVESVLSGGADPDSSGNRGRTPLLTAVSAGSPGMVSLLLKYGADPNVSTPGGVFPLRLAAERRDLDTMKALLAGGADVDEQGPPSPYRFSGARNQTPRRDPNITASQAPRPPVNLRAEALYSTAVRLSWEPGCDTESRFVVFRSSVGPHKVLVGVGILEAGATEYVDILPEEDVGSEKLYYWVQAVNGANASRGAPPGEWERSGAMAVVRAPHPDDDPPYAYIPERAHTMASLGNQPLPLLPLGRTALMEAAATGNLAVMEALLEAGSEIDRRDHLGETAFLLAARHAELAAATILLDRGADINAQNNNGETALFFEQQRRENRDFFEYLLDRGADPDLGGGSTPLMRAARAGRVDDVEMLLERGADIHAATVGGTTALSQAAANGYEELVDIFFGMGFDPTLPYWGTWDIGELGDQALRGAISRGSHRLLERLLKAGADPIKVRWNETLLHLAAKKRNATAVGVLLRYGADPARKNSRGLTAHDVAKDESVRRILAQEVEPQGMPFPTSTITLYLGPPPEKPKVDRTASERALDEQLLDAAAVADQNAAEHLIAQGAWIDATDAEGRTPLINAIETGDRSFINWVLDQNPLLNQVTERGYPALAFAIEHGTEDLVQELLERGAFPNLHRNDTLTPLQVAIRLRDSRFARLLLDYGASPRQMGFHRYGQRSNALMWAAHHGQTDTIQLLLNHGAPIDARDFSFVRVGGSGREFERRSEPNVLFWAAYSDDPAVIDLLIENGADLRHEIHGGHNALCWAVGAEAREAVQHFLSLGLPYAHSLDPRPENIPDDILVLIQGESDPSRR